MLKNMSIGKRLAIGFGLIVAASYFDGPERLLGTRSHHSRNAESA